MGEIADELIDRMWDRMGDPDFDEEDYDYVPSAYRAHQVPKATRDDFEAGE